MDITVTAGFIAGTIIGSFLNVVIYRLPRRLSLWRPGSRCPKCERPIPWFANVPIWGFIILRGRCGHCRERISWRYPVVEIVAGLIVAVSFAGMGHPLVAAKTAFLGLTLLTVGLIDWEHKIIPNAVIYPGIVAGFMFAGFQSTATFTDAITGFLAGGMSFWTIAFIGRLIFRRDAMGGGDVKLAAFLGVFLGWELLVVSVLLGFVLLTVIGWIRILLRRGRRYEEIPLAPFLAAGAVAAVGFGHDMIHWYLHAIQVH
jgi:leader peptidase (prepilin peptidase)/N-methyltransferase